MWYVGGAAILLGIWTYWLNPPFWVELEKNGPLEDE
jgi:hypothetical protein